jgi:hypothetical protein
MTQHPETVPTSWTNADEDFFRTTWDAFPTDFLAGAGVLLASYDDDTSPSTPAFAPAVPVQTTVSTPAHVTT